MNAPLIALLAALATAPACAVPHAGQESEDRHSEHRTEPPQADPHAEHDAEVPSDPRGAHATEQPTDDHAEHGMTAPAADPRAADPPEHSAPAPQSPPPSSALTGPRHAADVVYGPAAMADAREELRDEQGGIRAYQVLIDRLEWPVADKREAGLWDAQAWYGGDIDKLWLKSEGEGEFGEAVEEAEIQALWSHAVTPWFDFQAGVRYDFRPEPERAHLVLGLQGLVPYLFEVDAATFVSDEGDVSARIEAEYELLITQRLILQPRAEVELALQEVPELGIGSGFNHVELGLRLRYEIRREIAPYLGLQWERTLGETADFARAAGEDTNDLFFLAGINFWF